MRDGWIETTLSEAATVIMGQSPPGTSYNSEGLGMPFIQGSAEFGSHHPEPVKWCTSPKKRARRGDLLVSVRAPVGDTNFADQDLAIGRGLAIIRGGASATSDFLALALEHGLDGLRARSGSGMFESVTSAGLAGLPIVLPPPPEQRRIVDFVHAIDKTIEQLLSVVSAGRTAISTISSELIPWTTPDTALGDLCSIESRLVDPTLPEYSTLQHVGVDRIVSSEGRLLTTATAAEDGVTSGKHLFTSEDVVYSKIRPELRKAAVPGFRGLCSADAYPLRPGPRLDQRYLYELLLSDGFAERSVAKSGRTKMPKINRQELFSIEVEVPPIEEQQRIGELLGEFRSYVESARNELRELESMRAAVVGALLSGADEIPESYDQVFEVAS